jgi:hypothetical protein
MAEKETVRDDYQLIANTYEVLKKVGEELLAPGATNPALLDAYDSLLTTYFDIQVA